MGGRIGEGERDGERRGEQIRADKSRGEQRRREQRRAKEIGIIGRQCGKYTDLRLVLYYKC